MDFKEFMSNLRDLTLSECAFCSMHNAWLQQDFSGKLPDCTRTFGHSVICGCPSSDGLCSVTQRLLPHPLHRISRSDMRSGSSQSEWLEVTGPSSDASWHWQLSVDVAQSLGIRRAERKYLFSYYYSCGYSDVIKVPANSAEPRYPL